jgi:tetratricopeptide (TPR) repeat protein
MRIIHTPFDDQITESKYERNVRLLRKHLILYPDDAYQMLDLARLYLGNDAVAEVETLLQRARGIIIDHTPSYSRQKLAVCRSFYYSLRYGCLVKKNSDIRERLAVCREAIETLPECPLFYYHAANLYYALHQYSAAIEHFEKCIAFGEQPARDPTILYPRECLSSLPLAGLGYCLFRGKEYMQAARYFKASLACKQDHAINVMLSSTALLAEKADGAAGNRLRT